MTFDADGFRNPAAPAQVLETAHVFCFTWQTLKPGILKVLCCLATTFQCNCVAVPIFCVSCLTYVTWPSCRASVQVRKLSVTSNGLWKLFIYLKKQRLLQNWIGFCSFSKNTTWFATGLLALRELIARFSSGPDGFLDKTESCLLSEIFYKKNRGKIRIAPGTWVSCSLPETVLPSYPVQPRAGAK